MPNTTKTYEIKYLRHKDCDFTPSEILHTESVRHEYMFQAIHDAQRNSKNIDGFNHTKIENEDYRWDSCYASISGKWGKVDEEPESQEYIYHITIKNIIRTWQLDVFKYDYYGEQKVKQIFFKQFTDRVSTLESAKNKSMSILKKEIELPYKEFKRWGIDIEHNKLERRTLYINQKRMWYVIRLRAERFPITKLRDYKEAA